MASRAMVTLICFALAAMLPALLVRISARKATEADAKSALMATLSECLKLASENALLEHSRTVSHVWPALPTAVLALVTRTLAHPANKTVQFLLCSALHALLSAHLEWETKQVNASTVHSPAKNVVLVPRPAQNVLKKMG